MSSPRRINLSALDPSGAFDGQVATYIAAEKRWRPRTPTGGAGEAGKDRRWNVGAAEISLDEYNDGALDAAWIRVDGAAAPVGNVVWTEAADVLSLVNNGGDAPAAIHGIVHAFDTPMVVGDAFVTAFTLTGTTANYSQVGLVLTDAAAYGAGSQITADLSGHAGQTVSVSEYANWSSRVGIAASPPVGARSIFLRLVLSATNTWRADISPDGVSWVTGMATRTKAFSPTHVGFATTTYGSSTKHAGSFEFLRRVSAVS